MCKVKNAIIKLRKFNSLKDRILFQEKLGFSATTADIILDFHCYLVNLKGEKLVAMNINNSFLLLTPPKNIISGLKFTAIVESQFRDFNTDLKQKIPVCHSFIYKKKNYLNDVEQSRKYKNLIARENLIVLNTYSREKIANCFNQWKEWYKERKGKDVIISIDIEEIFFLLDNQEKYNAKCVFIEKNGKLLSFALGCKHSVNSNMWMNYCTYSLPDISNLSLFAKYERIKLYEGEEFMDFSDTITKEDLVYKSKLEISVPYKIIEHFYIET